MTRLRLKLTAAAKPDLLEVFTARCEARAYLWAEGELDLHEAIDKLQADAERDGLVAKIGQDEVQRLLAVAFAAVHGAHIVETVDVVPDPPPELLEAPKRGAVAEATLMAAEYLVRQGDTERLRRWLNGHSAKERIAIHAHLERKRCARSPTLK